MDNEEFYADELTIDRIMKAQDLICILYKLNLIQDAYIIGSIVRKTANKYSDIDIVLIHREFETMSYLNPLISYENQYIHQLINHLKEITKFRLIERVGKGYGESWYQIYNNELFHIAITNTKEDIYIDISMNISEWDC